MYLEYSFVTLLSVTSPKIVERFFLIKDVNNFSYKKKNRFLAKLEEFKTYLILFSLLTFLKAWAAFLICQF